MNTPVDVSSVLFCLCSSSFYSSLFVSFQLQPGIENEEIKSKIDISEGHFMCGLTDFLIMAIWTGLFLIRAKASCSRCLIRSSGSE